MDASLPTLGGWEATVFCLFLAVDGTAVCTRRKMASSLFMSVFFSVLYLYLFGRVEITQLYRLHKHCMLMSKNWKKMRKRDMTHLNSTCQWECRREDQGSLRETGRTETGCTCTPSGESSTNCQSLSLWSNCCLFVSVKRFPEKIFKITWD